MTLAQIITPQRIAPEKTKLRPDNNFTACICISPKCPPRKVYLSDVGIPWETSPIRMTYTWDTSHWYETHLAFVWRTFRWCIGDRGHWNPASASYRIEKPQNPEKLKTNRQKLGKMEKHWQKIGFCIFWANFSPHFLDLGTFLFCSWPTRSQHWNTPD